LPRPFSRAVALLTAILTVLFTLGGTASAVTRPEPPGDAGGASRVLLPNGAEALISAVPGGARTAAVTQTPGRGLARDLQLLQVGHRTYLIPVEALPYLGHGLAPSLFELSALERAEHGGRLPVALRYQGALHAPPGVTVTRSGPGAADGYLTRAGARRFGAALARQWAADRAGGRFGTDGLFASGLSIGVPGVVGGLSQGRAPARPDFPMHTLTVTGTTASGRPDTGDTVEVYDVNDLAAFAETGYFYHGTAKFSVPAGTYWALGTFVNSSGRLAVVREDVLSQFSVRGNSRVRMTARAASSQVTVATPRPAVRQQLELLLERSTSEDVSVTGPIVSAGTSLWVSPVGRPPADGALHAFTYAWLTSPRSARTSYAYTLDFPDPPGLIPPGQHAVAAGLATVRQRYYQDIRTSGGGWCTAGGTPFEIQTQSFMYCGSAVLHLPGRLVMYFSARPAFYWLARYWERPNLTGGQLDTFRRLYPGQDAARDWSRYPLHQGVNIVSASGQLTGAMPSAARAGNTLFLDVTPFTDNTPGHLGTGYSDASAAGRYAIYQNGVRIAHGNAVTAADGFIDVFLHARLSPRPSVIRFVLTASRASRDYPLSAASRDVWTWRTRREPAATIPPPWFCSYTDFGSHCAVQGMLTVRYDVAGLSLAGQTRPGRQQVGLMVSHLQHGPAARISSVRVQASVTGGRTWRAARVRRTGPDRFRAVFGAPGRARVTLRVTARDAAGDAITETIARAYDVAAGPRAARLRAARLRAARLRAARLRAARLRAARLRAGCVPSGAGRARCLVVYHGAAAARPHGLTPADLRSAYRLPARGGAGQTVADVVAFNTPGLARFLARYRRQFGLPPCPARSGCLRIVGQRGSASHLPLSGAGTGWDLEATTDVEMISAACPHCRILVVEARNDAIGNLAAAENTAARLGAQVISNSYGAREDGLLMTYARDYDHPGHTIVASAGDKGFGPASFPASLSTVTAVGGTQLIRARDARGWQERVWNQPRTYDGAGGSGCSAYVTKPAWQHDRHCSGRTVADTAAVASNVAVYEPDYGGWIPVGGTSVSAALIAGVYGRAGNGARLPPGYLYRHPRDLFDITAGDNAFFTPTGLTCGNDYLCRARPGYDAPTGLGTPDGTGAF
jgi:hypothetical protein